MIKDEKKLSEAQLNLGLLFKYNPETQSFQDEKRYAEFCREQFEDSQETKNAQELDKNWEVTK